MWENYDRDCDALDHTARWVCVVFAVFGCAAGIALGWFGYQWLETALRSFNLGD